MIRKFVFRYGFYTLLIVMLLGLCYIANVFEIRNKILANVVLCHDNEIRVYIQKGDFLPKIGDSFKIEQTLVGDIKCKVKNIEEETVNIVIYSTIDDACRFQQNSFLTGYIFTNSIKMKNLIVKKIWQNTSF